MASIQDTCYMTLNDKGIFVGEYPSFTYRDRPIYMGQSASYATNPDTIKGYIDAIVDNFIYIRDSIQKRNGLYVKDLHGMLTDTICKRGNIIIPSCVPGSYGCWRIVLENSNLSEWFGLGEFEDRNDGRPDHGTKAGSLTSKMIDHFGGCPYLDAMFESALQNKGSR